MSLASLRVLDKDVTNAPGRDSAFRPNVKARVRRGATSTPAPEGVPPQAPPLGGEITARLEPPDAAQRPVAPLAGPLLGEARATRLPPIVEAERPRGREPAAGPSVSIPPTAEIQTPEIPGAALAAVPATSDGTNRAAGVKRRIAHSITGGRRRAAFRGPELDEHFLATGEINTAGMTLKDILRMAEAKEKETREKERNSDDVRRTPREEDLDERPAQARSPDKPDVRSLAPQIRVVDGQIVVDQQSLTASAQASNPVVSHSYRRVEESGSRLNSNTYSNRKPTKRWTDQDTVVFYKALRQFGTDFTTIQNLFPTRSRHQIKNKYLTEDRLHPKAIEAALNHKSRDSSHYEEMILRLQAATDDADELDPGHENRAPARPEQDRGTRSVVSPGQNGAITAATVEGNTTGREVIGADDFDGVTNGGDYEHVDNGEGDAEIRESGIQQSTAPTAGGLTQESQAGNEQEGLTEAEASGPLTYLQRSMQRRIERGYRDSINSEF